MREVLAWLLLLIIKASFASWVNSCFIHTCVCVCVKANIMEAVIILPAASPASSSTAAAAAAAAAAVILSDGYSPLCMAQ
jgi:hypothetical protein